MTTEVLKQALEDACHAAMGYAQDPNTHTSRRLTEAKEKVISAAIEQADQPVVVPQDGWADYVEAACARIKAADDAAAEADYMLDSNDCIKVLRGEWKGNFLNDQPSLPASPSPAPALPAQIDEVAWLGEYDGKWLSTMAPDVPNAQEAIQYLCIKPIHGGFGRVELTSTNEANRALRFARKEDAELAIRLHVNEPKHYEQHSYLKHWSAKEHMWPAVPDAAKPEEMLIKSAEWSGLSKEAQQRMRDANDRHRRQTGEGRERLLNTPLVGAAKPEPDGCDHCLGGTVDAGGTAHDCDFPNCVAKPETQGEREELIAFLHHAAINARGIHWQEHEYQKAADMLEADAAALLSAGPARVEPLTLVQQAELLTAVDWYNFPQDLITATEAAHGIGKDQA